MVQIAHQKNSAPYDTQEFEQKSITTSIAPILTGAMKDPSDHSVGKEETKLKSCLKNTEEVSEEETASSKTKFRPGKRRVAYGRIQINEFPYALGDNPSCSDGAPLTITSECMDESSFEVEQYEAYHPSEQRRRKAALKLSVPERAEILLRSGYCMSDIVQTTLDVMQVKSDRADSYRNRKWDGVNRAIEKTTKTIRKAARRSSLLTSTAAGMISPLKSPLSKVARIRSGGLEKLQKSLDPAAIAA